MARLPQRLQESLLWIRSYLSSTNFSGVEDDFWSLVLGELASLPATDWVRIEVGSRKKFQTHKEMEYRDLICHKMVHRKLLKEKLSDLRQHCHKHRGVTCFNLQDTRRPPRLTAAKEMVMLTTIPFDQRNAGRKVLIQVYSQRSLNKQVQSELQAIPSYLSDLVNDSGRLIGKRRMRDFHPRIIPELGRDEFLAETLLFLKKEIASILSEFLPEHLMHSFNTMFLLPYYEESRQVPTFFQYFLNSEQEKDIKRLEKHGRRNNLLNTARSHRFKVGEGICGRIALTKAPTYLSNWRQSITRPEFNYDVDFLEHFERHFVREDWLYSVPVMWRRKVICVVQTGGSGQGPNRDHRKNIFRIVSQSSAAIRLAMELDEKQKEIKTGAQVRNLSAFHSHNVSKAFIQPILNQCSILSAFERKISSKAVQREYADALKFMRFIAVRLDMAFKFLRDAQTAGIPTLKLEKINLRSLLEDEVTPLVQFQIGLKSLSEGTDIYTEYIRMNVEKVPKNIVFKAHSIQMIQTLFTLIDNCLDALPRAVIESNPQRGRIIVSATIKGKLLKICVSDCGKGMPTGHLKRLRRHLTGISELRASNLTLEEKKLTTKGGENLGLGLHCAAVYLSFLLGKQGRGRIDITSTKGKGTAVTIVVPIIEGNSINI